MKCLPSMGGLSVASPGFGSWGGKNDERGSRAYIESGEFTPNGIQGQAPGQRSGAKPQS
jgi:hypothetical protein